MAGSSCKSSRLCSRAAASIAPRPFSVSIRDDAVMMLVVVYGEEAGTHFSLSSFSHWATRVMRGSGGGEKGPTEFIQFDDETSWSTWRREYCW